MALIIIPGLKFILLVECYALLASGSAHAKLEARTAFQYEQCGIHIYIERERKRENCLFTSLGRLATLANKKYIV